jgi:hypothetical protein
MATSVAAGQTDQVAIVYDDRSEAGIDRFDSPKLNGTGLQIYLNNQGKPLVIDSRPLPQTTPDSIPIALKIPEPGNYEISLLSQTFSTFSTFSTVTTNPPGVRRNAPTGTNDFSLLSFILEDRLLGLRHALVDNPVYAFSAGAGILEGRFLLRVIAGAVVEEVEEVEKVEKVWAFVQGGNVIVNSGDYLTGPLTVGIYDLRGRVVELKSLQNAGPWIIPLSISGTGIYTWKLASTEKAWYGKVFFQSNKP